MCKLWKSAAFSRTTRFVDAVRCCSVRRVSPAEGLCFMLESVCQHLGPKRHRCSSGFSAAAAADRSPDGRRKSGCGTRREAADGRRSSGLRREGGNVHR